MSERVSNFDPQRLLEARRAKGLSHDALGALIGATRPNLIAYEKGRRVPSPPRLAALAEALGVDPLELTTTASAAEATFSDLRMRAGVSNSRLAHDAGMSLSYLSMITTGVRPLRPAIAERLAAILGVTVDEVGAAVDRDIAARAEGG
jgi:transcriptional regulator with XRE-family HTH domain